MTYFPKVSILFLICILIACKKSSDPAPVDNRIAVIDVFVYDSQLWTTENRFPPVADAEVDVMRIPVKFQYGTTGPIIDDYDFTEEDIQSSLKSVFKGRTDKQGKLTIMLDDTTDRRKYRWFAIASKGSRSIFSPDGILCAGVFEDAESVKNWAYRPGETNSVGDRKLYDWNRDGLIIGGILYDKAIGLPLYFDDSDAKMWILLKSHILLSVEIME